MKVNHLLDRPKIIYRIILLYRRIEAVRLSVGQHVPSIRERRSLECTVRVLRYFLRYTVRVLGYV